MSFLWFGGTKSPSTTRKPSTSEIIEESQDAKDQLQIESASDEESSDFEIDVSLVEPNGFLTQTYSPPPLFKPDEETKQWHKECQEYGYIPEPLLKKSKRDALEKLFLYLISFLEENPTEIPKYLAELSGEYLEVFYKVLRENRSRFAVLYILSLFEDV